MLERQYETMFILRPTLNDQEIAAAIESYRDLLVRQGGEIILQEDLGKKRLAYDIKRFQNGHYALFQYQAEPSAVKELERSFKITEDVLRYLTIKIQKKEPPVSPAAEEAKTSEEAPAPEEAKTSEEAPAPEEA